MFINRKAVDVNRRNFLLFSFALAIISLIACNNNQGRQQPENLSAIIDIIDKGVEISDSGNTSGSIKFVDSAIAGKSLSLRELFKVLEFKSGTYYWIGNAEKAMLYNDSILHLIEENDKTKYKEEYALANYSKGDILLLSKDYNEAYSHYYKARLLGKNATDPCTLGEYSYRIGMLLFQQSSFAEAAENFKQAFHESSTCSFNFTSYYRRQEILNNIALSYQKAGLNDSGLVYALKAIDYITSNDGKFQGKENFNEVAKGVVYGTTGRIYKQLGEYDQAANSFNKSININSRKGFDNQDAVGIKLEFAELYLHKNNIDSMGLVLQNTRKSLDSSANAKAEIEWNRLMWKYYESQHQVSKAYDYLGRYIVLKDSIEKASVKNDVRRQVKMAEDRYEITSLHEENKLKSLYLVIFIITSVLAVVIVLFYRYHYSNSRKNLDLLKNLNNKIEVQNISLEKALNELEASSKEKDRILRAVAHDLRTPAASISMLTDLLLSETDASARNEMLKLVKTSSDNSLSLITEILEAAGTTNRNELAKEATDINELLKNTVALLRIKAAEKQQQVSLYLLKEPEDIQINKEKIGRVVTNLLTNAIKFSHPGTEIQVKAVQLQHAIQIIIQDAGIGIPAEMKSKVFDMFTEAKRLGTSGEKTFGLGLSICHQVVEAHNGKIWFESEQGKGTTFFVELPQN